jgi:hypothetical protein
MRRVSELTLRPGIGEPRATGWAIVRDLCWGALSARRMLGRTGRKKGTLWKGEPSGRTASCQAEPRVGRSREPMRRRRAKQKR